MFFNDHSPPHFHVEYGEFRALVDIQKLEIKCGDLPRRAQCLVLDWAKLHQQELIDDWDLCLAKTAKTNRAITLRFLCIGMLRLFN